MQPKDVSPPRKQWGVANTPAIMAKDTQTAVKVEGGTLIVIIKLLIIVIDNLEGHTVIQFHPHPPRPQTKPHSRPAWGPQQNPASILSHFSPEATEGGAKEEESVLVFEEKQRGGVGKTITVSSEGSKEEEESPQPLVGKTFLVSVEETEGLKGESSNSVTAKQSKVVTIEEVCLELQKDGSEPENTPDKVRDTKQDNLVVLPTINEKEEDTPIDHACKLDTPRDAKQDTPTNEKPDTPTHTSNEADTFHSSNEVLQSELDVPKTSEPESDMPRLSQNNPKNVPGPSNDTMEQTDVSPGIKDRIMNGINSKSEEQAVPHLVKEAWLGNEATAANGNKPEGVFSEVELGAVEEESIKHTFSPGHGKIQPSPGLDLLSNLPAIVAPRADGGKKVITADRVYSLLHEETMQPMSAPEVYH